MTKYHKIDTLFKRDPANKHKTLLMGEYSRPEFEYLKDNHWEFTEKVDGTNIRVIWNPVEKKVTFGGKTDNAQIPAYLITVLNDKFSSEQFTEHFDADSSVILYGEGYGAKIQKGGGNYYPDGVDFVLFDVKVGDVWLERPNVDDIATKLGVPIIPVVGWGSLKAAVELIQEKALESEVAKWRYQTRLAEGIVMRPTAGLSDRLGRRIITKLKFKDFPPTS